MEEIYDCTREALKIGPFSYLALRSVDLWLQQSDDLLCKLFGHFCTSSDAIRAAFAKLKSDPYPDLTLFRGNSPRFYLRQNHEDGGKSDWVKVDELQISSYAY